MCAKLPDCDAREGARLLRWLREWRLEQALLEEADGPAASAPADALPPESVVQAAPTDSEPSPAVGQVRLLAPELDGAGARPVFVAVLEDLGEEGFLVAPFSRFAEPAVPGELLTGEDVPALRVLCLWNTGPIDSKRLRRSWEAGTLSGALCRDALRVRRALTDPAARLEDDLLARTGPPLLHPDDPRHVYLSREAVRLRRIAGAEAVAGGVVYRIDRAKDLPMAAEDNADYGDQ